MAGWGNLVAGSGEAWVSTLRLGSGVPASLKGIYSGSLSVNPAAVAANSKQGVAVTLPGVASGDVVLLTPPSTLDASLVYGGAVVTGADTVTAYLHNVTNTGVNEEQRISFTGATGGNFTLTFGGQTTGTIAYNAPAADVQTALEALSNVDPGDITASGGPMNSAYVALTFGGAYADVNVGTVALGATGLLPVAVNEEQDVTVTATSGTFKLTFSAQQTGALAFDITAANLKTALEGLSSIGAGNVDVIGGPGDAGGTAPYIVTFIGALGATNVAQMTKDDTLIVGGGVTVTTFAGGVTPPAVTVTTQTSGSGAADEPSGSWQFLWFDLT